MMLPDFPSPRLEVCHSAKKAAAAFWFGRESAGPQPRRSEKRQVRCVQTSPPSLTSHRNV